MIWYKNKYKNLILQQQLIWTQRFGYNIKISDDYYNIKWLLLILNANLKLKWRYSHKLSILTHSLKVISQFNTISSIRHLISLSSLPYGNVKDKYLLSFNSTFVNCKLTVSLSCLSVSLPMITNNNHLDVIRLLTWGNRRAHLVLKSH